MAFRASMKSTLLARRLKVIDCFNIFYYSIFNIQVYTQNFPVINLFYKIYKSRKVTLVYYKKIEKVNGIMEQLPSGPFGRVEETEMTANSSSKYKKENLKLSIQICNPEKV